MTTALTTRSRPLAPLLSSVEALRLAWLTSLRNAHTRAAYTADLDDFAGWCEAQGVTDALAVTRQILDLYATDQARGKKPATIARRLTALASFYARAVEEGLLDRSPMAHVKRPKVSGDSGTHGLDREAARAFLRAAEAASERDAALATLLLLNGLRASEACAADIADLTEERGHRILRVRGKGGTVYNIPLAPRTFGAVNAHVADRTEGPLLLNNQGGRLDRHDVARIVRRLSHRAGVAGRITPHSLRHAFVTAALDAGVPLHVVQDGARHADPRTTQRYNRQRFRLDDHATYRLAAFLSVL